MSLSPSNEEPPINSQFGVKVLESSFITLSLKLFSKYTINIINILIIVIFKSRDLVIDISGFTCKLILHGLELILFILVMILEISYRVSGIENPVKIYSPEPMILNISTLHGLYWKGQTLDLHQQTIEDISQVNTFLKVRTKPIPAKQETPDITDQISTTDSLKHRKRLRKSSLFKS